MTQQWGNPGQPGQGGQPAWNRPTQAWGTPAGYPTQGQAYPTQQYPAGPAAPVRRLAQPGQYRSPQAQFGQPSYGQPGGFPPANRAQPPGGPGSGTPFGGILLGLVLVIGDRLLRHRARPTTSAAAPRWPMTCRQRLATHNCSPPVAVPSPDFDPPADPAAGDLRRGHPVAHPEQRLPGVRRRPDRLRGAGDRHHHGFGHRAHRPPQRPDRLPLAGVVGTARDRRLRAAPPAGDRLHRADHHRLRLARRRERRLLRRRPAHLLRQAAVQDLPDRPAEGPLRRGERCSPTSSGTRSRRAPAS